MDSSIRYKNYSSYAITKSKGVNMLGDISSTDSIGDNSCIFRTTSAAPSGFPSTYAVYTRFRSHTSGSYDLWLSANSSNLFYAFSADGGFPTTSWKTVLTSSNYSSYVLPISGGAVNGNLSVSGTVNIGNAIQMYSNGEGANLVLGSPNDISKQFQFDTYDGNLRLYYSTTSGNTLTAGWSFRADGTFSTNAIDTNTLQVFNNTYPALVFRNSTDGTALSYLFVETTSGGYAGTKLRIFTSTSTYVDYSFTTNGTIIANTFQGSLTGNATTASGLVITKANTSWKANTAGNIICYEGASTATYDLPTGAVEILSMRHNGSRGVALGIGWASGGRGVWFNSLHDDTSQDQWLGWRRLVDSSQFSWNSSTSTLTITI